MVADRIAFALDCQLKLHEWVESVNVYHSRMSAIRKFYS